MEKMRKLELKKNIYRAYHSLAGSLDLFDCSDEFAEELVLRTCNSSEVMNFLSRK